MTQDDTPANSAGSGSLALVAMDSAQSPSGKLSLPEAGFLVQLIASAGHIGQFRRYRRAEPALAMTSYRSAALLARQG